MALSAENIAIADLIRNGRMSEVAIVTQIEKELAELAKLMVPSSVAHSRTKMFWIPGQDTAIFKSPADGNEINGWYCSVIGTDPTQLETPNKMVATFVAQYLYRYNFGDNTNNSQTQFNENWSAFLAAFAFPSGIRNLAGKRFIGHEAQMGVEERTSPAFHFFTAKLRFQICDV